MGFPRQEYWSGLSFLSPGDLPDSGIEPASLTSLALAGRFFSTVPTEKPYFLTCRIINVLGSVIHLVLVATSEFQCLG